MESIGKYAFFECKNLKSVMLSNSIASMGESSSPKFSVSLIKIPILVVSFDENPFAGCIGLEMIGVSENPNFIFVDGVLMSKEIAQIICCCSSKSGDYSMPDTVKTINARAFERCIS